MSAKRFGRVQKATAILPLALLSAAWTASLAGVGAATVAADAEPNTSLPDGTSVPSQAIEAPASVSSRGAVSPDVSGAGDAEQIVAHASTSGIPSAALAAYQRAETVINSADKSCNLTWQLIAGIGRVESNHGRANGNQLNNDGVATPGIYGLALNGQHHTALIRDTDAGQFDDDTAYDRAVGPMQFIPSTWSVVGVDADGDGQRNPQDIDDAALATAVYLCSGNDDLATTAGQHAAVYRYNHSASYVDLVLSIMTAYADGDFTSVPNSTTAAGVIAPDPNYVAHPHPNNGAHGPGHPHAQHVPTNQPGSGGETTPPPTQPTDPPETGGNGNNGGGGVPNIPLPPVTLPPLPTTSIAPVDDILTMAQAIVQCTLDGYIDNILVKNDKFDRCLIRYTH
ncbi:lytic murein transglycosylase [Nocardioides sp.]|uniref:lytic transglycosylase domain-containing protein n=1 Tax=Nocardioides sp. TaxID=35761 RepID=UPI0031FF20EA|nr:secreted protein [Nocardioides sp.]